ncbi:MAG: response regulator [Succinivibrio sp.]|nr:response regulator [Succinivibrio sp.]
MTDELEILPADPITVLVIDDDMVILKIVDKILTSGLSREAEVLCTHSGYSGLDMVQTRHVDLILLDVNMPEIDGLEVLDRLRELPQLEHIPVIMMSADMVSDLEADAFRRGATDFIHKPFAPEVITQRIERHLRLAYLQRNLHEEVLRQTELAEKRLAVNLKLLKSNERLFNETVLALTKTVDAKDPYTRGHSVRVADYAQYIAKFSGCSADEQRQIYYMGLLHDIGKIGIPGSVINKNTRLTDEEYEMIKQHPTIGAHILSFIKEVPELSLGAHYHHERYDGRGYPDGLKGEEIPRQARIIAVADAYDAMTSQRSYRECLPQDEVRKRIEQGSGTQFDPYYAKVMLRVIDHDKDYQLRASTFENSSEQVF